MFVDVDRLDTWSRYKAGMCDKCQAHCCTMPVEVRLPDLVRLGWVDPFEAEHESAKNIAKRLTKAGLVERMLRYPVDGLFNLRDVRNSSLHIFKSCRIRL